MAECSATGATPNATLCETVTHTGLGGGCVTSQVPTSNKSYCADHQVFTLRSPSKLLTIPPRSGTIICSLSLGPQISLDPVPNHKIISPKINLGNLLLSGLTHSTLSTLRCFYFYAATISCNILFTPPPIIIFIRLIIQYLQRDVSQK